MAYNLKNLDITLPKEVIEGIVKQEVAKIIEDMQNQTLTAMLDFYMDYTPTKYRRNHSLYNMWEYPDVKYNDNGAQIIFTFNDSNLTKPSDMVYEGPFMMGYHGGPRGYDEAPRMSPSPWDIIKKYAVNTYNAEIL